MNLEHYHGDIVRKLFIAGGVIMIAALPFFYQYIPFSLSYSLLALIIIAFFAGIIAPTEKWIIALNAAVAAVAVFIFEYYAVNGYIEAHYFFSFGNQVLAVIFFVAFYYGVKTVRGAFQKESSLEE